MARRRSRPWGAGTLYKRSDGRWAAQLFVTESLTGRRVRRTVYGRSKEEVEQKRDQLLEAEAKREPIPPSQLTVGQYLREWLELVARPRVRANTLANYQNYIERFLVPDLGSKPLGRLSAREVRMYLEDLRRRGLGSRSVQYVHATLRVALEDAVRDEIIPRNVAKLVRVARPQRSEPEPLLPDEVKQLLRAHRDSDVLPMLVVFALLGMRRSEVLGLKWSDVDLGQQILRVLRGLQRVDGALVELPTKTLRSRRTIPLPGVVVKAFEQQQDRQAKWRVESDGSWVERDYVFTTSVGTPIDPRNCTRQVQNACRKAGVRVVRLHDFRHGCVSVLLALGVPPRTAMEIVGHSTIEMTMGIYGHVNLDAKRAAMDQLGALFDDGEEDSSDVEK